MHIRQIVGGIDIGAKIRRGNRRVVFFQAEDGIRDLVRSRGLGDVYKRQVLSGGEEFMVVLGFRLNPMGQQLDHREVELALLILSLIHI